MTSPPLGAQPGALVPVESDVVPGCYELPWAFLTQLDALPCDVFVKSGHRATLYATLGVSPTTLVAKAADGAVFLVRTGDMSAMRRNLVRAIDRTLTDARLPPVARSKTAYAIVASITAPVLAGSSPNVEDLEIVRDTVAALTQILLAAPEEIWRICAVMQEDPAMHLHAINTAVLTLVTAREIAVMTEDELRDFGLAALLHDLGKMRLPRALLDRPELTPAQEIVMRTHPRRGVEMLLERTGELPAFARAVGEHHERCDGSGYPAGLAGEEISLAGRLVAIVDTFDALMNGTPGVAPLTPFAALASMRSAAGTFDDELLRRFIEILGGRKLIGRRVRAA